MSCDFKPGDEVVCIYPGPWRARSRMTNWFMALTGRYPRKGRKYTISFVGEASRLETGIGIDLVECPAGLVDGRQAVWCATKFRKVQKRDLTVWLATENTIEGPVRPKVDA